jgi:hypothetical protein
MNECPNRRAVRGRIDRAICSTRVAFCRAAVELANLLDGLLLFAEARERVAFSAEMEHRTRLG